MPRRTSPKLTVIPPLAVEQPPRPPIKLGAIGQSLWDDIVSSYEFSDRASYETLGQACSAADRADRCREQIDVDGECIKVRGGGPRPPVAEARDRGAELRGAHARASWPGSGARARHGPAAWALSVPTKRRKIAPHPAAKLTPEAIECWRKGDYWGLHRALHVPIWLMPDWWCDPPLDDPPDWPTSIEAYDYVCEMQRQLIEVAGPRPELWHYGDGDEA